MRQTRVLPLPPHSMRGMALCSSSESVWHMSSRMQLHLSAQQMVVRAVLQEPLMVIASTWDRS